jgi:hypothetical protein
MRRLAFIAIALATLALPATAAAKEVLAVQACGTDDCVTTKDKSVLTAVMDGGPPSVPPANRARSYVLRVSMGDQGEEMGTWMAAYVPRFRMLVGEDGAWMALPAASKRALDNLTAGLKTFPPSELGRLGQAEIDLPTAAPPPPIEPASAPVPARAPDGGFAWLPVTLGIAALLGLGGVLLFVRRRRPGGGAAPRAV